MTDLIVHFFTLLRILAINTLVGAIHVTVIEKVLKPVIITV